MIVDFFTFLGGIVEFFLTMIFYIILFVAITTACLFVWLRYKLTGKGFWTSWGMKGGGQTHSSQGNSSGHASSAQSQSGQGGRIFQDNEGEYIDFEEVE